MSRPPARASDALWSAVCAHNTPRSHATAILAHMAHSTCTACKHEAAEHAWLPPPLLWLPLLPLSLPLPLVLRILPLPLPLLEVASCSSPGDMCMP